MRLSVFLLVILCGCQNHQTTHKTPNKTDNEKIITTSQRPDPFSFSKPNQVKASHLELNLKIKFKQNILDGFVVVTYDVIDPSAKQLILDTRDLKIKRVESLNDSKYKKLNWRMGNQIAGMGTELSIDLPADLSPIKIFYETSPTASGLQWLKAEQTSTKKHPFLFSQSQAIHARSWIPLQDTPSVRVTYNATFETRPELKVLLSADNNEQDAVNGVSHFSMKQAIPAYLIAIAVGDLKRKQISKHVAIYAEADVLDAASYEFAATESMISATEAMYGPYRWGQYDLLILPPSFPFGGMENPKLSHITPTVIAGDRSLDSLIAHELAHSWSGNLVTNALWQDAWLNEGFTSYIESRIIEAIYGRDRMMMESTLTYQALMAEMNELPADSQKLINPSKTSDPDDYFSAVSYDKGRFFLEWMEHQVGRADFDQFLNNYFNHFAFKSLKTTDFVKFLQQHLLNSQPDKITMRQVNTWLNEPGLPDFFVPPTTHKFDAVDTKVIAWLNNKISASDIDAENWTTTEWLHFLRALPEQLSISQLAELDDVFKFNAQKNSEISHDWLLISIRNNYQTAYPKLIEYLTSIGRTKLIKPLYEAMMKKPELHNLARNIYQKARPGYHNIASAQLDLIVSDGSTPAIN